VLTAKRDIRPVVKTNASQHQVLGGKLIVFNCNLCQLILHIWPCLDLVDSGERIRCGSFSSLTVFPSIPVVEPNFVSPSCFSPPRELNAGTFSREGRAAVRVFCFDRGKILQV
jgi:hypothetical protein